MQAVILAGGFGSRLAEKTDNIPKPMVEIGGIPILVHIMAMYSNHGINDFVICCGYKGHIIKDYFLRYWLHRSDVTVALKNSSFSIHENNSPDWNVTLVDTGPSSMTGGRLLRVKEYIKGDTFCFTYGDGVSDLDIGASLDFHDNHGGLATMTAVQPPGRFGAVDLDGTIVNRFVEKPSGDGSYINGGFFVLNRRVMDLIEDDSTVWEEGPLKSLAESKALHAFVHSGFWHPMDTLRDNKYLNELWKSGNPPWGPINV